MVYLKNILEHNRRKLAKCGNKERDIEEQMIEENSDERIMRDYEIM